MPGGGGGSVVSAVILLPLLVTLTSALLLPIGVATAARGFAFVPSAKDDALFRQRRPLLLVEEDGRRRFGPRLLFSWRPPSSASLCQQHHHQKQRRPFGMERRRRRRRRSTGVGGSVETALASKPATVRFEEGDLVELVTDDGGDDGGGDDVRDGDGGAWTKTQSRRSRRQRQRGIVRERRGGGWYAVEPLDYDDGGGVSAEATSPTWELAVNAMDSEDRGRRLIKRRGKSLRLLGGPAVGKSSLDEVSGGTTDGGGSSGAKKKSGRRDGGRRTATATAARVDSGAHVDSKRMEREEGETRDGSTAPPVPTIVDLDAVLSALEDGSAPSSSSSSFDVATVDNNGTPILDRDRIDHNQLAHHASFDRWVIFSDLHCAPSTLPTALAVLSIVHETARSKNAGVLFLGDFWHHRGTVRVDCLNAVLNALSKWTVPLIMIPGNHDQVTFGGEEHALTPLRNAYRLPNRNGGGDVPGPLIFTHPTLFRSGLFVPHLRDSSVLSSVLATPIARNQTKASALFVHADVTGARTNDYMMDSTNGIALSSFPRGVPIYSGHFHKPHVVSSTMSAITSATTSSSARGDVVAVRYVGSPYQTGLAEAGQDKSLVIVDARRGWIEVESVPIRVGRRHFRVSSATELFGLVAGANVGPGDSSEGKKDETKEGGSDLAVARAADGTGPIATATTKAANEVAMTVSKGDRVVITMDHIDLEKARLPATVDGGIEHWEEEDKGKTKDDGDASRRASSSFDDKIRELRRIGASVEVRVVRPPPAAAFDTDAVAGDSGGEEEGTSAAVEDLSPPATLAAYLDAEVRFRRTLSNETADSLLAAGRPLLEEVASSAASSSHGGSMYRSSPLSELIGVGGATDLRLEEVTVEGFGPFRESSSYPLHNRGLVLLRGTNRDGGSDSNGSGKSTLAFAPLWALTGSSDPRPMQDARVSDIVHDLSKSARVSVRGTINSTPFVVTRTKSASKGSLTFRLDGKDMTKQSIKETQSTIDDSLGVGPQILARTIFHGQHSINGLLEATDAGFKEELSLIVPLQVWRESAALARSKSRFAAKEKAEVEGMITIRTMDLEALSRRCETSKTVMNTKLHSLKAKEKEVQRQLEKLMVSTTKASDFHSTLGSMQEQLNETTRSVEKLESSILTMSAERDLEIRQLQLALSEENKAEFAARQGLRSSKQQCDRSLLDLDAAQRALSSLKAKWKVTGAESPSLLDTCPTCGQPFSSDVGGHSRQEIRARVKGEFDVAEKHLNEMEVAVSTTLNKHKENELLFSSVENNVNNAAIKLHEAEARWEEKIAIENADLVKKRRLQSQRSVELSMAAKKLQRASEIESIKAASKVELQRYRDAADLSTAAYTSISEELNRTQTTLRALETKKEGARSEEAIMSRLADIFGPRGVQTFVLQNAVHALRTSTQMYLDELSDGSQKLELTLDSGDRILRSAAVRGPEGKWIDRPLSSLSGGQWRRCSLSLSLAFSDLVAKQGRLCPSLLVLDEPLTHLDSVGRAHVGSLLRKMLGRYADVSNRGAMSTILIILQDLAAEELEESFDMIDEVVKYKGDSVVLVDGK